MKLLLTLVFVVIAVALVFGNPWVAVGGILLIALWGWLIKQYSNMKTVIHLGFTIAIAVLLIGTIGVNLYKSYVAPYTSLSRNAFERSLFSNDIKVASAMDPRAFETKGMLYTTVQIMELEGAKQDTIELKQNLENLKKGKNNGGISEDSAYNKIKEIKLRAEKRAVQGEEILSTGVKPTPPSSPTIVPPAPTYTQQPTELANIIFIQGETVKFLQLDSEQWTPFVITPSESAYNIDITDSTEIVFADKTRLIVTPNMPNTSIGIHRGIFKFRGKGTVTITIKFS
ncbi:MAG: hypothetical protein AAB503_01225 [Patescibacteria group bacterium]